MTLTMNNPSVPLVYLAGPIEFVEREAAHAWRDEAKAMLVRRGMIGISPFRETGETPHRGKKNGRLITSRDKHLTNACQFMIVRLMSYEEVVGTLIEFGWYDWANKPVFVWTDDHPKYANHPMVTDIAAYVSTDLEDLIKVMQEFLP